MTTIEERFVGTIDALDIPDVDLAPSVIDQLSVGVGGGDRHRRPFASLADRWPIPLRLGPVPIIGALLVIIVASTLTIGPARQAVADWLGIGATSVEIEGPTDPATDPATDTPRGGTEPDRDRSVDDLGQPVDDQTIANPLATLGSPDRVLDHPARGRSFTWSPSLDLPAIAGSEVGAVLSVRPVDGAGLALKSVAADVGVEVVTVALPGGAVTGLWIPGTHELVAAGADVPVLAERVLLWELDGIEYRLESGLPLDDALALAARTVGGTDLLSAG